ncbi:hypothetical protein LCGC14_0866300 [marine sediment metagenome]|uniref:Uncharacterized protein n=1 Tax=marine sediment metagenome TaxID=412755 RepID=A0A0F9RQN5_9ZZZZ
MPIDVKRHIQQVGPAIPSAPTISPGTASLPAKTAAAAGRRTTTEGQRQTEEGLRLQERADVSTANKQLNDFEVQVKLRKNEFDAMIRRNNNPETYFDEYDKFKKDIDEKLVPNVDHFLATDKAAEWLADSDAGWRDKLDIDQDQKATENSVASFRATRNKAMETLDPELLMRTYERAVGAGIVLPEVAEDQLATDLEKIDKVARANAQEVAINNEMALARAVIDTAIEEGKTQDEALELGLDFIRKSALIPEDEKQERQEDLNAEETYRRSIDKRQKDKAVLEQNNAIQGRINEGNLESIVAFVKAQPDLDEIQKGSWIDAIKEDAEAKLKDDEANSPFNQGSNAVFQKWLNMAQTNPKNVDMNDMTELTKKGLSEGITSSHWRTINTLRNTALKNIGEGDDPLDSRTAKLADEYLGTFKTDDPEGWIQSVNDYNKWYLDFIDKNKREPTPRESETKLQFLTTEPVRTFWVNDLPDAQVRSELRDIPLEAQREFVKSAKAEQSTTKFLREWRARPKKFTKTIADHYIALANGDPKRADELATKDGYTE